MNWMNWKRIVFPLSIMVGWAIPLAWLGSIFDATLEGSIIGLVLGGLFALLGELIGNWLARSLSVSVILGATLGAGAVLLIYIPVLVGFGAAIEHTTSDYGAGMPNILGLFELFLFAGIVAFGSVVGAFIGGIAGFCTTLIGSIIVRIRRRQMNQLEPPALN